MKEEPDNIIAPLKDIDIIKILWSEWRGTSLAFGQKDHIHNVLKWEGLNASIDTYATQPQKVVKLNIELCLNP